MNLVFCFFYKDVVDARKVKWHKKIHKEKAKELAALKEQVRVSLGVV